MFSFYAICILKSFDSCISASLNLGQSQNGVLYNWLQNSILLQFPILNHLCYSKTVYTAWRNEVLATRQNNKRKVRLAEKYARLWKHRVDLAYTATCMVSFTSDRFTCYIVKLISLMI